MIMVNSSSIDIDMEIWSTKVNKEKSPYIHSTSKLMGICQL